MVAIAARDLFHLYRTARGDVAALRGLSLEVAAGERVSVLGPSGSGKSTLLSLCAGLRRPSSGSLAILGRPIDELPRGSVGIVRQHYHRALPRELTIEEIVELPLRLLGRRGREERRRVAETIRAAGLARRAGARPAELSGGEQQRVAICAAVVKRPRLLLADEPTGELDAASTAAVIELLIGLTAESRAAALIVTHDPTVAAATDRTIHVRDGRLAAEGTTRPMLIVDEQGWLRLPRRLREHAGIRERVQARAGPGRVELLAEDVREVAASAPEAPAAATGASCDVVLDRVTKRYDGDSAVLDDLSWTFERGRLHVLAGPSGSGKTTMLNLVAALDRPDRGEIRVGADRVDGLGPDDAARWRQRAVGYVSQHSTLVEFLSARENVELALTVRGFEREQATRCADRWLEWVGLGKLADRAADELSGGEQRRVALARAMAPAPRVLLADEPTAHLDRLTGRVVIGLLRQAARESGTTILAAGHDPDLIAAADAELRMPAR